MGTRTVLTDMFCMLHLLILFLNTPRYCTLLFSTVHIQYSTIHVLYITIHEHCIIVGLSISSNMNDIQDLSLLHFDMSEMRILLPNEDVARYLSIYKFLPGEKNDLLLTNMDDLCREPMDDDQQGEDDSHAGGEDGDHEDDAEIEKQNMNLPDDIQDKCNTGD